MKKFVVFITLFLINVMVINANSKFKVTLSKCIDGDTAKFIIDGEEKTVRFLSIDTPEIAHPDNDADPFGDEASNYTCNILKKAITIKLQYDSKSDKTDKYGRVLAWVFVDNSLLQEQLIEHGLAKVKYTYDDYMYTPKLQELELKAQEEGLGLWGNNYNIQKGDAETDLIVYIIGALIIGFISLLFNGSSKKKSKIK